MKQDLSDIEKNLLECAKKGKHVFLYGKSSIKRKAMVRNIGKEVFKKRKFIGREKMDGEDVYMELTNSHDGVLLEHKGLLFVNNLYCDPKSETDFENYIKLAKFIRDIGITVQWLVVYASNRKCFPDIFKRQFEMISLKSEVVKGGNKEKKKKRRQRIPDNTFRQLCKDVEREVGARELSDEKVFFKEVAKMSKLPKYDESCRGYTWSTAKRRYYKYKKANQ